MTDNGQYWEQRYEKEGMIWGESPSRTAHYALEVFRKHGIKSILVPGSGYGGNTKLFSSSGYEVTGVEISEKACGMARSFDTASEFNVGSVLDMSSITGKFDSVYCFNVLHLFRKDDRKLFLAQCSTKLKEKGLMFFTVFSDEESSFGKGREVEHNTFETRPGRPAHYYTEDDLKSEFSDYKIIEIGMLYDPEDHGEGPHTHALRYILAENSRTKQG
ncbi:MAG: methyltransferase domain-containing protein [Dehalococcoidales bacterium]|nr:methyltransferase domain-containing protein [Dehalococcoidales bacterium]